MTENRIFTLCRMITWVVFLRMFWNFISSLPVKRGGSLSFLVGTISNVLVMEIGWTDVGSGGYISVSCAHSNTSSIIHHYRILNHNELKFVTHIFQIFCWVNAHLLIYGLYKLGLFWILKIIPNSSPRKILIQIIPNGEIRNNLSFNLFGFTCFDFLCKILKCENETQASDCMIIGYCEPLVFNIHGYLLWVYV